jgi:hypothetical protein
MMSRDIMKNVYGACCAEAVMCGDVSGMVQQLEDTRKMSCFNSFRSFKSEIESIIEEEMSSNMKAWESVQMSIYGTVDESERDSDKRNYMDGVILSMTWKRYIVEPNGFCSWSGDFEYFKNKGFFIEKEKSMEFDLESEMLFYWRLFVLDEMFSSQLAWTQSELDEANKKIIGVC